MITWRACRATASCSETASVQKLNLACTSTIRPAKALCTWPNCGLLVTPSLLIGRCYLKNALPCNSFVPFLEMIMICAPLFLPFSAL